MKTFLSLENTFLKRIKRMINAYDEAHHIWYQSDLETKNKGKTGTRKAGGVCNPWWDGYSNFILKELLSASKTKVLLSNALWDAILDDYRGSNKKVVVVKVTTVQVNHPHSLTVAMSSHSHEDADTMIPLHVLNAINDSPHEDIDV